MFQTNHIALSHTRSERLLGVEAFYQIIDLVFRGTQQSIIFDPLDFFLLVLCELLLFHPLRECGKGKTRI